MDLPLSYGLIKDLFKTTTKHSARKLSAEYNNFEFLKTIGLSPLKNSHLSAYYHALYNFICLGYHREWAYILSEKDVIESWEKEFFHNQTYDGYFREMIDASVHATQNVKELKKLQAIDDETYEAFKKELESVEAKLFGGLTYTERKQAQWLKDIHGKVYSAEPSKAAKKSIDRAIKRYLSKERRKIAKSGNNLNKFYIEVLGEKSELDISATEFRDRLLYTDDDEENDDSNESIELINDKITNLANTISRLFLRGNPGTGKTESLHKIFNDNIEGKYLKDSGAKIPVLIKAKGYDKKGAIKRAILKILKVKKDYFDDLMESYDLLIMIDGLNEVKPSLIDYARTEIQELMEDYYNPSYIITSRKYDFESYRIEDAKDLEIKIYDVLPLDEKKHIIPYINKVFDTKRAKQIWQFIRRRENTELRKLVSNPMYLTMLLVVAKESERKRIPQSKGELYHKFMEELLNWENTKKTGWSPSLTFSIKNKKKYISELAYHIITKRTLTDIEMEDILSKKIKNDDRIEQFIKELIHNNLIVSDEEGKYSFVHDTYSEYFAAVWLCKYFERHKELPIDIGEQQWFEPILMCSDIFRRAQILDAYLDYLLLGGNKKEELNPESNIFRVSEKQEAPSQAKTVYTLSVPKEHNNKYLSVGCSVAYNIFKKSNRKNKELYYEKAERILSNYLVFWMHYYGETDRMLIPIDSLFAAIGALSSRKIYRKVFCDIDWISVWGKLDFKPKASLEKVISSNGGSQFSDKQEATSSSLGIRFSSVRETTTSNRAIQFSIGEVKDVSSNIGIQFSGEEKERLNEISRLSLNAFINNLNDFTGFYFFLIKEIPKYQELTKINQELAEENQKLAEENKKLVEENKILTKEGLKLFEDNQKLIEKNQELIKKNQKLIEVINPLIYKVCKKEYSYLKSKLLSDTAKNNIELLKYYYGSSYDEETDSYDYTVLKKIGDREIDFYLEELGFYLKKIRDAKVELEEIENLKIKAEEIRNPKDKKNRIRDLKNKEKKIKSLEVKEEQITNYLRHHSLLSTDARKQMDMLPSLEKKIEFFQKNRISNDSNILDDLALAKEYVAAKQYAKATQHFEKVLNLAPTNPDGLHFLVRHYKYTENYNEGLRVLKEAQKKGARTAFIISSIAEFYKKKGDFKNAKKYFALYKQNFGTSPYVLLGLASVYMELGQNEEAIKFANQLLDYASFPSYYYSLLGDIYRKSDSIEQAIHCFEQYLKFDAKNAIIWGNIGNCYRILKDTEKALEAFLKEYGLTTNNFHCQVSIGDCYFHLSKYTKALRWFKKAEKISISDRLSLNIINCYRNEEKFDDAIQYIRMHLKKQPRNPLLISNLADCYKRKGDFENAIKYFKKHLQLVPGDLFSLGNLADCFRKDESYADAIAYFEKQRKADPDNEVLLISLANAYKKNGRFVKAIRCFEKYLKIHPNDTFVLSNLGDCYYRKHKPHKSIEYLERLVKIEPNNAISLGYLADCYRKVKNFPKAIEHFEKQVELEPNNAISLASIADSYKKIGNLEKAIQYFERQIKLEPDNVLSIGNLADCYKKLGKLDKAIELSELQIKLEPNNPISLGSIADSYKKNKNYEKAIEYFQKQIELEPKNTLSIGNLADCYKRVGNIDKAIELFEQEINLNPKNVLSMWSLIGCYIRKATYYEKESKALLIKNIFSNNTKKIEKFFSDIKGKSKKNKRKMNITIKYLEKIIQEEPSNLIALFKIADYYKEKGRFKKAIKNLEKIIEIEPENIIVIDELANIYHRQSQVYIKKKHKIESSQSKNNLPKDKDNQPKGSNPKNINDILVKKVEEMINQENVKDDDKQIVQIIRNAMLDDKTVFKALKNGGLNLSVFKKMIETFTDEFNLIDFGHIKFVDFARDVCKDSGVGVFRGEKGDSKLGIRSEGLEGLELLPDIERIDIQTAEGYRKILEYKKPRYLLPSKEMITEVVNILASQKFQSISIEQLIKEILNLSEQEHNSDEVKNIILILITTESFVLEDDEAVLADQKITLNEEFNDNPDDLLSHLRGKFREKLMIVLQDNLDEKIIDELV